jgi:thioredoxin 1
MIQELTDTTFETFVTSGSKPVIVDFWAPWCGPCKSMAPELEAFSAEHADKVTVAKLNIDEYPSIAQELNIFSIPTMIGFSNGSPEVLVVGAQSKNSLSIKFAKYL